MVIAATVVAPKASRAVNVTAVCVLTVFGRTVTVFPTTFVWTASATGSEENTVYGGWPPRIVSVAGVPEYTIAGLGVRVSAPGVLNTLFGAPLPPPQPLSPINPVSATNPANVRAQTAKWRYSVMMDFLMMMS
jgi:hypothetical protein